MDRLTEEIQASRAGLQPRWDDWRAARVLAGVTRRRAQQQAVRATGLATLALALVVGAVHVFQGQLPTQAPRRPVARAADPGTSSLPALKVAAQPRGETRPLGTVRAGHRLRLADGSLARLSGESSELDILANHADHISLRLRAGAAVFEVVPDRERRFVVSAGELDVVVVGTVFEVDHRGDEVWVSVTRGKVRVLGPDGVRELEADETASFPSGGERGELGVPQVPTSAMGVPASEPPPGDLRGDMRGGSRAATTRRSRPRAARAERAQTRHDWRRRLHRGEYDAAYAALLAQGRLPGEPALLMDAADAARLSGHPEAAVTHLRRVVVDHPESEVAPLAAFTLGRVQLERLGHMHRAARAFARARELAPHGSLAQDALAREVEARSKAGEFERARALAERYTRTYPDGRRLRAVQLYGGLPSTR